MQDTNEKYVINQETVSSMKELLVDIRNNQNQNELTQKIKNLENQISKLKAVKKYWIVWESEKEPEQVVVDCKKKLPILKEIKERFIKNENSWKANILIEWDNYHTLQVLNYTHKESIDVIYIDPPYNTWARDWKYNNDYIWEDDEYRHSKWLNFMNNRLLLSKNLLKEDWIICVTIDDYELPTLWLLLDEIFWEENHLWTVVIRNNPKGRMTQKKISLTHEYALFFWKSIISNIKKLPVLPEDKSHWYKKDINWTWYLPVNLRKQWVDSSAINRKWVISERYYPIYYNKISWEISTTIQYEIEILPIDSSWQKRIWRRAKDTIDQMFKDWDLSVNETKLWYQLYFKFRWWLDWEMPKSIWVDSEFSASEYWTKELDIILWEREKFQYPKSLHAVKKSLLSWTNNNNAIILDFFAWSWTTWQAVLSLNKEDWGNRQFILCTNNENNICEEITYERIKRVSQGYKNSKWENIEWLGWNLKYYQTDFLEIEDIQLIEDKDKLELTYKAWEIIALREWTYNEILKNKYFQFFDNNEQLTWIYFIESSIWINNFKKELKKLSKEKEKIIVYIFGYSEVEYTAKDFDIPNLKIESIPEPILKIYKELNRKV